MLISNFKEFELCIDEIVDDINVSKQETIAYIKSIFYDNLFAKTDDYFGESVTLIFAQAKEDYDFERYKNLGDWLLFAKVLYPEHLARATDEYYNAIAQSSYYKCHVMLYRKWPLYEELADTFPTITHQMRQNIIELYSS